MVSREKSLYPKSSTGFGADGDPVLVLQQLVEFSDTFLSCVF